MNKSTLQHIRYALHDMAFQDIKRASSGKAKMGAFILGSCFIDYLAGFVVGRETRRNDYMDFVRDFLPGCYDPEKLYRDLRCRLVHNYAEGGSYWFVDSKPALHCKVSGREMFINLQNFIDDLESALERLLSKIERDPGSAQRAENRYRGLGLVNVGFVAEK